MVNQTAMFCNFNVKRAKSSQDNQFNEDNLSESPYEKLDIIRRILESTRSTGAQEQRLMYGSYLSYLQIDEYLSALEHSALVRHDRGSRTYRITARGMDFLASLRQMDLLMKSIDN